MSKLKGLIFDLDGTLLNTLTSLANCFNRALQSRGFATHEVPAFKHFIGDGARVCIERCLPEEARSDALIDELLAVQQKDYLESWHQDVTLYEGILETLEQLQQRAIPLTVLTNKDHLFAERCIEHFFPRDTFISVQGFTNTVPHKPEPSGANALLAKMNVEKSAVAIVGDTSVDIETAKNAGLVGIGVKWGFREEAELLAAGANHIISEPTALLSLV